MQALRDWLEANERTVTWLARQCDRSTSYMWRVVNDAQPMTAKLAPRVSTVTGIPVEELLPQPAQEVA